MRKSDELVAALKKVRTIRLDSTLIRTVPLFALIEKIPMEFLFSSGKRNRFNLH
jgi:hypothetical protein